MACDICGSGEYLNLWDKGRWGLEVRNVVCKGCGLIYVTPQEGGKIYRDELPSTETGQDVAKVWETLLDIKKDSKVLDVGCGVRGVGGYFNCRTYAIDPDWDAIKRSSIKWPHVWHECVTLEGFETDVRFDYILLIHTLEHLKSPRKALEKIRTLLKPDGKLGIEVPCAERPYDLPECKEFDGHGLNFFFQKAHLYTFSLHSLASLLNLTGFMGVRWDFGAHLRCVAVKSSPNGEIEREDAGKVKERLLEWHNERICRS